MRAIWLGLCVALAAISLLPLFFSQTHVVRDAMAFPAMGIATVLVVVAASWIAKALKFHALVKQLGQSASFAGCLAVSLGCDFAFVASPAGIAGYPATVLLFGRVGVSAACAMTVAAVDQILDLLFFAIAIPLALILLFMQNLYAIPFANTTAALVTGMAVIAACALASRIKFIQQVTHGLLRLGLNKLRRIEFIDRQWQQVCGHVQELRAAPKGFRRRIALATVVQWLARYATLSLVLAWTGHAVPYAAVFVAQSVSLHAGQWTGIPGGMGTADGILLESLRPWLPIAPLLTGLIVWRMATFHLTIFVGGLAFALLAVRKRFVANALRLGTRNAISVSLTGNQLAGETGATVVANPASAIEQARG